jgi:pimeloyl-ACP methyl ester carboxylesterase
MLLAAKRGTPIGRLVMNDVGPFVPWNGLFRLKGHLGRPHGFGSLNAAGEFLRGALAAFGPTFLRGIDLWTVWNAVTCPTLVLRGADSEVLLAATVEEMGRRKPGTQSVEFAGVGHAPALFDGKQIDAVRSFLKQRRGARREEKAAK